MTEKLNSIRNKRQVTAGVLLLRAVMFLIFGSLLGIASKWLDLNSDFLGDLFSRIMIWFTLCTGIAVYSKSPLCAAVKVFAFCMGMLGAYYLSAIWWDAVWGTVFMYGWTAFSLCSPVFAFFTWYAKGRGTIALILKAGIIAVSVAAETLLFGFRIYNAVLVLILAYMLFENRTREQS